MRKVFLLCLLLLAASLHADINAFDRVPGATLLLPYFEVDLAQPGVVDTTFTVGNTANSAVIAHVTMWTDRGVPTQTFNIRLDAYDVATVNIGDIFWNGTFPQTTAGSFGSCSGALPPAPLNAAALTALRNAHTGLPSALFDADDPPGPPSALDECGGANHGDNRARGFITIDVTNACTALTPRSAGYFVNGGLGIATNQNVLWGEYSSYHTAAAYSHGEALVSLEASSSNSLTNGDPDDYTFYRRITGSAADNREALGQSWTARYSTAGEFTNTRAFIWRDPGRQAAFGCSAPPLGITTTQIVVFDEKENPSASCGSALGLATQSVNIADSPELDVPFDGGYIFYTLSGQSANPAADEAVLGIERQSYVTHVLRTDDTAGQIAGSMLAAIDETTIFLPVSCGGPCNDGIDNDGDGLIDAGSDPGCRGSIYGVEQPQCSDGFDNDGDLAVDWPADPHCWGPNDNLEANYNGPHGANPQCDDGIDNDGDGKVDYPDDPQCNGNPNFYLEGLGYCNDGFDNDGDGKIDFGSGPNNDKGCSSLSDFDETNGACADGIDNDGDGDTDYPADAGCSSTDGIENPQCDDGIDNDGDGKIDFGSGPNNDTGCSSASDNQEVNSICNDGIDNDGDGKIDFGTGPNNDKGCASIESNTENPPCNDGIDNDGDGFIDYPADKGCTSPSYYTEYPPATQCSDGLDNDGNGKIDFPADPTCDSPFDEFERAACNDGIDNDGDGLVDFGADPGCASSSDNTEFSGATQTQCSDGIDNDGDGLRDYPADPGCFGAADNVEYNAGQPAVATANIPALSPLGMIVAAALLALVAAIALRGTTLG
ncbi:MAG TPA: hypothetical protein VF787_09080 [Thermoanaerobaculia bacterium]